MSAFVNIVGRHSFPMEIRIVNTAVTAVTSMIDLEVGKMQVSKHIPVATNAVSYTHLDVYKRQV